MTAEPLGAAVTEVRRSRFYAHLSLVFGGVLLGPGNVTRAFREAASTR